VAHAAPDAAPLVGLPFNSALYREKCRALNGRIASRYAAHPALEAWQVDGALTLEPYGVAILDD